MGKWMMAGVRAGAPRIGAAAVGLCLGLAAGAAQAATTLTQYAFQTLYTSAYGASLPHATSGVFDLSSYLSDGTNQYRITSASLNVTGFSNELFNYNNPSNNLVYTEGFETINGQQFYVYTRTELNYVWRDDVADTLLLTTSSDLGTATASQQKVNQLRIINRISGFTPPNILQREIEYRYESSIYGAMNFNGAVSSDDLAGLNGDGLLDYTVSAAVGQFRFDTIALTFERELIVGSTTPEPLAWTMMVFGFGAAGASLRARRRRWAAQAG